MTTTTNAAPPRAAGRIVMTGATGFVGSHFVYLRPSAPLTAIVRAASDEEARGRVLGGLEKCAASYRQALDRSHFTDHVDAVTGDITRDLCGVDAETCARLRAEGIDTFWHFAASLHFEERKRAAIFEQNVIGTRNALALAKALGVRRFVYVSTAYTVGRTAGAVAEELHPVAGPFNNCYEETKCTAEHEVTAFCREHGIDVRIVRPSIVVGPSSTLRSGGTDTGLYGFCREVHRLAPVIAEAEEGVTLRAAEGIGLNLVPVDHVALDLLDLESNDFAGGPIRHLASTADTDVADTLAIISTEMSVTGLRCGARAREATPLESVLDRRTVFYDGYLHNPKVFERSLPPRPGVTREDVIGYVAEFARELRNQDCDSVFERCIVRSFDGTPLAVYSAGDPSLPPLVLANAYAMPAEFYVPLVTQLRSKYRILTWETRGLPDVSGPFDPEACGVTDHARDMRAVLDHFGVGVAKVVGWCSAAQVVLRFASLWRDRVEAAVLLGGSFRLPDDVPTTDFHKNLSIVLGQCARGARYAKTYSDIIFGNRGGRENGEKGRVVSVLDRADPNLLHMTSAPFRTPEALYRYGRLFVAVKDEPEHAWTEGLDLPVLLVSGSDDDVAHPAGSRAIAARIGGARLLVKEGGDHFLHYYDKALGAEIDAFFTRGEPLPGIVFSKAS